MDLDAIENVTRESRDEEQHDKKARRKPWQPARMLETPTRRLSIPMDKVRVCRNRRQKQCFC